MVEPWKNEIMMQLFMLFILTYLLGAVPTAYIYCRARGIDIRKEGSGNVGATNAARLFGKSAFFVIFFLDALKGFIPVYFFVPFFTPVSMNVEIISVLILFTAVIGHIWSVFLKFKGGKGVSTSVGGVCALMPIPCVAAIIIFGIIFFITRIVSIGSICAAFSLPLFSWVLNCSTVYTFFSFVLCCLIIFTHSSNIKRLFAGEEIRMEFRKKVVPDELKETE